MPRKENPSRSNSFTASSCPCSNPPAQLSFFLSNSARSASVNLAQIFNKLSLSPNVPAHANGVWPSITATRFTPRSINTAAVSGRPACIA
ncbi:MAG: hypothetical protein ACAH89_10850 [Rariglobus sp.]